MIAQSAREAQPLSRHAKFDSSNQHVDLLLMTLTQAPPLKRGGPMCGGGQQEWRASTALILAYVTKFALTLASRDTDSGLGSRVHRVGLGKYILDALSP